MRPYPNIKAHLDKFRDVITSDNHPYGLHRSRDESFFRGAKIISLRKCVRPTFTYTEFDCYVSQTFYIIKTNRINLKYLTAILNSTLIECWLRNKGKMQGRLYQVDKEPLLAIPIFAGTPEQQRAIATQVDSILAAKQHNPEADTSALEREIDRLVYRLYDLTQAEIDVVEASTHP
jgi:adenine-specific DNA-methyltransferase